MTTPRRVAITAFCALVLAVTVLGESWSVRPEGWAIATLGGYGLALLGAFFVNRWWALLPAGSTVAVGWLGSWIHQPPRPWHEEIYSPPLDVWIVVVGMEIVVPAAFIALGLLARLTWDHFRGKGSSAVPEAGR